MTRVGNQTNSTDPHAINSRVFVGNLNTYLVAKEEVEKIFQRYGRIIGISMHKGYGFVQFTNVWDARNAVMGEDGRTVAGQVLDVNMVLEPKPHQVIKKRTNSHLPNHPPNYLCAPQMTPPLKRPRTDLMGFQISPKPRPKMIKMETSPHSVFQTRVYHPADLDILICGNCKEQFPGLQNLIQHKKSTCKLRFSCRCHVNGAVSNAPKAVVCAICQASCSSWWELVHHVQSNHGISIYQQTSQEINTPPTSQDDSTNTANLTPSTSDGGKECSSCGSDTQSGLVENDWGLTAEADDNEEDAVSHFSHNHVIQKYAEKAVDTADLKEMADQG